jgi:hypothetical protein
MQVSKVAVKCNMQFMHNAVPDIQISLKQQASEIFELSEVQLKSLSQD